MISLNSIISIAPSSTGAEKARAAYSPEIIAVSESISKPTITYPSDSTGVLIDSDVIGGVYENSVGAPMVSSEWQITTGPGGTGDMLASITVTSDPKTTLSHSAHSALPYSTLIYTRVRYLSASYVSLWSDDRVFATRSDPSPASVSVPSGATYAAGQNLDITINFAQSVTVTGSPTIALSFGGGGTAQAAYISGSGSAALVFRYTVTGSVTGGVSLASSIALNGGTIKDGVGNDVPLTISGGGSIVGVTVDAVAPGTASINQSSSAPTNATSVNYTITFSESVTGVSIGDFTLSATGTAAGTIASVSGSGTTYTITVNGITGSGDLRLDLNSGGTGIVDAAGNHIAAGFTAGQSYTFVHTSPVNSVAPEISGSTQFGGVAPGYPWYADVSVSTGTWSDASGDALTYSYQWYRADDAAGTGSVPISGATASTYQITMSDVGKRLIAGVTAHNGNGGETQELAVHYANIQFITPYIDGVSETVPNAVEVGRTLTIMPGYGYPTALNYSYQWYRVGHADIATATSKSYTVTSLDLGIRIGARAIVDDMFTYYPSNEPLVIP